MRNVFGRQDSDATINFSKKNLGSKGRVLLLSFQVTKEPIPSVSTALPKPTTLVRDIILAKCIPFVPRTDFELAQGRLQS